MDGGGDAEVKACVRKNITHDGTECLWERGQEAQVTFALIVVILVGIGLYALNKKWKAQSEKFEKASGVLNEASMYAQHLAEHFMPSRKAAKYQFRGIRPPKNTVNIGFHELGLTLHSGAKCLDKVTGEFKAGRMCAIMGPSGAGKTTFMNVLCGKATYGVMSGKVLINGRPIPITSISSVVGFVPQDDIVHNELTVREQIRFAAYLRNAVQTGPERLDRITEDVLNVMQIDHIQNSIVGSVEKRGISGGQRKRVNIGLELAGQPVVLFLDEPTSGLDSTSSLAVVYSLKRMCQLGMNCIMVIHQPRYSLFTLFDDVLLLGKGGHTVYLGPSGGAKQYFEDLGFVLPEGENRADWFMDVISGEVSNDKIPNFVPKMLFDLWDERDKRSSAQDIEAAAQHQGETGRDISENEDVRVFAQVLEEEWDTIDINRDGFLDEEELKVLLSRACRLEPSTQVVRELLNRMAPGNDVVTKSEFRLYLTTLTSHLSKDNVEQELERSPTGMLQGVADAAGALAATLTKPMFSKSPQQNENSDDESGASSAASSDDDDGPQRKPSGKLQLLQRRTPGFCGQVNMLKDRAAILWWRQNEERAIFLAAIALGGLILATQDWILDTPKWDAMAFVNTHTCIGLLCSIFSLNCFGRDQPIFWRERNRGLNVLAFYLSGEALNTIDLGFQCFLFCSIYYELRRVQVGFFMYMVPYAMVVWACSGWGYMISAWVPIAHGPFVVSLVVFVVCGLLGNPMNLSTMLDNPIVHECVSTISITRWSIPMSFLYQLEVTDPIYPKDSILGTQLDYFEFALTKGHWEKYFGYWWAGILALFLYGLVLRILTYLGLLFRNRDKQV